MLRVHLLAAAGFLCAVCPPLAHAMRTHAPQTQPLRRTLAVYDLKLDAPDGDTFTASRPGTTLAFAAGSRRLVFNGVLVLMNAPVTLSWRGRPELSVADIRGVIAPLLDPSQALKAMKIETIVIDPGHGGEDAGAGGAYSAAEKNITLDIAGRVMKKLATPRLTVRLTRTEDTTLALNARSSLAAEWKADLFVSIHLNSSGNPEAMGLETYTLPAAGFPGTAPTSMRLDSCKGNGHDALNTLLAYYVHQALLKHTGAADRGIRRARFAVLRNAPCPAILVECGFLSNNRDLENLRRADYLDAVAEGITAGIQRMLRPAQP